MSLAVATDRVDRKIVYETLAKVFGWSIEKVAQFCESSESSRRLCETLYKTFARRTPTPTPKPPEIRIPEPIPPRKPPELRVPEAPQKKPVRTLEK